MTDEERELLYANLISGFEHDSYNKTSKVTPVGETAAAESTNPPYPSSFSEIIDLLQRGESIPGADELVVEATNDTITDSKLDIPKKPWECKE